MIMKPMTHEQKQRIFNGSIEMLEKLRILINDFFKQEKICKAPHEFSQFYLFVLILNSDANVLIKQYCTANQRWEEIYLIRQIYILMNEGKNKIIGKNGDGKNLNNTTYWNDNLKMFVEQHYPKLLPEFKKISDILINYRDNEFQEDIRILRNLSVHYDEKLNTEKFFNIFNTTIVDNSFQLFGKWLGIINTLFEFASKIVLSENG